MFESLKYFGSTFEKFTPATLPNTLQAQQMYYFNGESGSLAKVL